MRPAHLLPLHPNVSAMPPTVYFSLDYIQSIQTRLGRAFKRGVTRTSNRCFFSAPGMTLARMDGVGVPIRTNSDRQRREDAYLTQGARLQLLGAASVFS